MVSIRSAGRVPAKAGSGSVSQRAIQAAASKFLGSPDSSIIDSSWPTRRAQPMTRSLSSGERDAPCLAFLFTVAGERYLSPATVNKKAKQGASLSPEESERVIGCARLVGQLESMIEESGDPKNFDAAAWIARWLTEPLPAFAGTRPADLMDTMEGQSLVSSTLAKLQSGAYA